IYDGNYNPRKGVQTPSWRGKVSVIAACTPAIEDAWALNRGFGERFVQVRWPRGEGVESALSAFKQVDEPNLTQKLQKLVKTFVQSSTLAKTQVTCPDSVVKEFANHAEMAAMLRGHVIRDSHSHNRPIIDFPQIEAPTRLMKAMIQVAKGS